jgi:hypothetical protein
MNPTLERAITLFVRKEKQERMRALAKRREDLRDAMLHDRRALDPTVLEPCPANVAATVAAMKKLGAGVNAFVFDDEDAELPLLDAVTRVFGRERDAIVVSNEVAFYENHEGERFLLKRR